MDITKLNYNQKLIEDRINTGKKYNIKELKKFKENVDTSKLF